MKNNKKWVTLIVIIFTFLILLIVISLIFLWYWNKTITNERVDEVNIEIVSSSEWIKRKKYVFTENNTYEIEDRLFIWYFNSMDIYRELKKYEWKECELTTIWTRIWFFSMYKTVIDLKCF